MIRVLYKYYLKIRVVGRTLFWRFLFKDVGKGSKIYGSISVINPENISLGSHSYLNEGVFLNGRDSILIGDHVHISPGCIINTGGLDYVKTGKERDHVSSEVVIDSGVWLGSGVIVNPGVKIGENSVVGAGAVVVKDIPNNKIALGVPARPVDEIKKKSLNNKIT